MKTKLVLWGNNANDEKILIAMQLKPDNNMVDIWTFPEKVANDEFAKKMLNEWRNDAVVEFPAENTHIERELTIAESLLPDDIKTDRTDIIQRAQTEWHFIVLSSKLNEVYQTELGEIKERVDKLTTFDGEVWNELKGFWDKVLEQVRDRNLFREHINNLRDGTNSLFERLKALRSTLDEEFKAKSKDQYDTFQNNLAGIEKRIADGINLSNIFEELKDLQRKFKNTKMTRDHKSKIWEKLDSTFKVVKEKRFGPSANRESSPVDRINRRYDGLLNAIEKMKKSIGRDQDDLVFENRKIASTDGQLEAQIRQAKIKMIEERIRSKEEKLGEMNNTKKELEERMKSLKQKEIKRQEKEKHEQAKLAAKAKIKEEMQKRDLEMQNKKPELDKAAMAITGAAAIKATTSTPTPEVKKEEVKEAVKKEVPKKEESLTEAIGVTVGETFEDVVDTVKAVAEVVGSKISNKVAEVTSNISATVENITKPEGNVEIVKEASAEEIITEEIITEDISIKSGSEEE